MRYCLPFALFAPLALTACSQEADEPQGDVQEDVSGNVQRVSLGKAARRQAEADPSPDTSAGFWSVSDNGQSIGFGDEGEAPLMSLACDVSVTPSQISVIRHARALPGQGALFPVIGNGMTSRFAVDATLGDDGWHWEANLPAQSAKFEVFAGPRDLIATLPGRGSLEIGGSRIPGEFLDWCRAGGVAAPVENLDEDASV